MPNTYGTIPNVANRIDQLQHTSEAGIVALERTHLRALGHRHVLYHLAELERLGLGATKVAHNLFEHQQLSTTENKTSSALAYLFSEIHSKLFVRNAMSLALGEAVVHLLVGQMVMDTQQNVLLFVVWKKNRVMGDHGRSIDQTYETFGGIVHEAQLEATLLAEGVGQGPPQCVRWYHRLLARLELIEQSFQGTKDARLAQTRVSGQFAKTSPKDVEVPEHLHGTVEKAIVLAGLVEQALGV